MNALADLDRDRLTRLLGMLGSTFDGEVANAGRLADKLVRGAGRTMASACIRFPHLLDKWEWQFVSGLQRFPRLSIKQRTILIRIVTRLRVAGCSL